MTTDERDPPAPSRPAGPAGFRDGAVNDPAADGYHGADMQSQATRLMTAVQAGDPDAFDQLARSLRGRAFQVARSLVGSHDDALDLCQETFLKVFRARATYRPEQPFLPWFHRILRNTCFSFLRKHRRLRKHSLTVVTSDGEELDWEIVDPAPGPVAGAEADEHKRLFREAMQRLSARDREILALRHFKELAYKEIAASLGIPEGTVMSRLFHARRRLREALGPMLGEPAAEGESMNETQETKGTR